MKDTSSLKEQPNLGGWEPKEPKEQVFHAEA